MPSQGKESRERNISIQTRISASKTKDQGEQVFLRVLVPFKRTSKQCVFFQKRFFRWARGGGNGKDKKIEP